MRIVAIADRTDDVLDDHSFPTGTGDGMGENVVELFEAQQGMQQPTLPELMSLGQCVARLPCHN